MDFGPVPQGGVQARDWILVDTFQDRMRSVCGTFGDCLELFGAFWGCFLIGASRGFCCVACLLGLFDVVW